jgi:hypothetical protein
VIADSVEHSVDSAEQIVNLLGNFADSARLSGGFVVRFADSVQSVEDFAVISVDSVLKSADWASKAWCGPLPPSTPAHPGSPNQHQAL